MPSRAEPVMVNADAGIAMPAGTARVAGAVLHGTGFACLLLVLWRLLTTAPVPPNHVMVQRDGAIDAALASLVVSASDTVDVTLDAVPSARARATLRALRGSGRSVLLGRAQALPAVAVDVEAEWRAGGGTRIAVASDGAWRGAIGDRAGLLDSVVMDTAGLRTRSGPVQGAVRLDLAGANPAVTALVAGAPQVARVLVAGTATWESKFLVAALEEAGWPVDVAVTLSPRVTVGQGSAQRPSRARHAIVLLLPGAPSSVTAALGAFVREGGGVVIVGEAARLPGVAGLRAGAPGVMLDGEAGAEASEEPRHGLDLVPVTTLAQGAVPLEFRDGRVAVAARRLGAGRVVQVGYDNSWLWRMAGGDESPAAHRRWWSTLLSGLVPVTAPRAARPAFAGHDTLDAAPVAALARDLGLPAAGRARRADPAPPFAARLDLRWLLALALVSFTGSWLIRRWRGFT
ncbi:MAG: hypothetical protein IT355_11760 [Gemmatimonadaceae bacterium]|nr:hypothetical protein [Gemmatimonadaceae bacterium]